MTETVRCRCFSFNVITIRKLINSKNQKKRKNGRPSQDRRFVTGSIRWQFGRNGFRSGTLKIVSCSLMNRSGGTDSFTRHAQDDFHTCFIVVFYGRSLLRILFFYKCVHFDSSINIKFPSFFVNTLEYNFLFTTKTLILFNFSFNFVFSNMKNILCSQLVSVYQINI